MPVTTRSQKTIDPPVIPSRRSTRRASAADSSVVKTPDDKKRRPSKSVTPTDVEEADDEMITPIRPTKPRKRSKKQSTDNAVPSNDEEASQQSVLQVLPSKTSGASPTTCISGGEDAKNMGSSSGASNLVSSETSGQQDAATSSSYDTAPALSHGESNPDSQPKAPVSQEPTPIKRESQSSSFRRKNPFAIGVPASPGTDSAFKVPLISPKRREDGSDVSMDSPSASSLGFTKIKSQDYRGASPSDSAMAVGSHSQSQEAFVDLTDDVDQAAMQEIQLDYPPAPLMDDASSFSQSQSAVGSQQSQSIGGSQSYYSADSFPRPPRASRLPLFGSSQPVPLFAQVAPLSDAGDSMDESEVPDSQL